MGDNSAADDEKDVGEEGEEDTSESEDTSEDEADDASDDDADDGEGASDEDEPDDADKGDGKKGSSKKDKEGEQDEDDEEDEPPTRKPKTPADFVAERRGRKLAKLQGKDGKGGKGKDDTNKGGDADEDEDEDGLAPEDAAAIDRHLDKRLAPILAKEEQSEVETQIAAFISSNPDFKPYAAKVQKWALHDAWKNVPIKQIFYAAAGDKLMSIGAKRSKVADDKAKKGRTGGSGGEDNGSKSWKDAPLEDVGKEIERVKLGRK